MFEGMGEGPPHVQPNIFVNFSANIDLHLPDRKSDHHVVFLVSLVN